MEKTFKLIVLNPEKLRGKSFELYPNKGIYTVGRSSECDICIKHPTLTSLHCNFIYEDDVFVLEPLDSTNGERINNVQVQEKQKLKNSDIIELGAVEFLYDDGEPSSLRGSSSFTRSEPCLSVYTEDFSKQESNLGQGDLENHKSSSNKVKLIWITSLIILVLFIDISLFFFFGQKKYFFTVYLLALGTVIVLIKRHINKNKETFLKFEEISNSLNNNSVYLPNARKVGIIKPMIRKDHKAMDILSRNFSNIMIIDCAKLVNNENDTRLCASLYVKLLSELNIDCANNDFNAEDINQILKDEDSTLFCFINAHLFSDDDLSFIRGFSQENHRCLFVAPDDTSGSLEGTVKI